MSVMDLLTHPAFGYGLLALAIGLCTFLFITLKQDLHRVHTSHARAEKHRSPQHELVGALCGDRPQRAKQGEVPEWGADQVDHDEDDWIHVVRLARGLHEILNA